MVAGGHRRARFLQSALRIRVHAAGGLHLPGGDAGRLGRFQLFAQLPRGGQPPAERGLRVGLGPGLAVGCLARRLERPFVGVDGARQRQPVVALRDGFVRLLHRGGRRGERFGRVLVGAGGPRRVDGALGAIDFFLGRFGTGSEENQRADRSGETTHRPAV